MISFSARLYSRVGVGLNADPEDHLTADQSRTTVSPSAAGLLQQEHSLLREEMRELKHCQITFLSIAISSTGVLLSLSATLCSHFCTGVYLFPLIILIPFWWIFFDKATTITRIVGYYRVLEEALLTPSAMKGFKGWERALRQFRQLQKDGGLKYIDESTTTIWQILMLRTSHPYWVLTYYSFAGLSFLCLTLNIYATDRSNLPMVILSLAATALVAVTAYWNMRLLLRLISGANSYRANEIFWRKLLHLADTI